MEGDPGNTFPGFAKHAHIIIPTLFRTRTKLSADK